MKDSYRSFYLRGAAIMLTFAFVIPAFAETPREELVHSYILLREANNDYGGHRIAALKEVEAAGRDLGLLLKGEGSVRERQLKSDEHLLEARKLLIHSRDKLEDRDRLRIASHVEKAIREIDASLASVGVSVHVEAPHIEAHVEVPVIQVPHIEAHVEVPAVEVHVDAPRVEVGHVETPREELVHAWVLIKEANNDYHGHRLIALKEVETAGKDLGLELRGTASAHERQFKSNEHLIEARRLLVHAREKLEERDRLRVAARVDKAVKEIDESLRVR